MKALFLVLLLTGLGGEQLSGHWILQKLEKKGQSFSDPRWTCSLDFQSDAKFHLKSCSAGEIHLRKPDGTTQTRAQLTEVILTGDYSVEQDWLRFKPLPRWNEVQHEFARTHWGKAETDGSYRVRFKLGGGLSLEGPAHRLVFQRHEKRS